MAKAPVCHISPALQGAAPHQLKFPSIPNITTPPRRGPNGEFDWGPWINAFNAMRTAIEMLMNQRQPFDSKNTGGTSAKPQKDQQQKKYNWNELSRKTVTKKIYNPDDSSQWVEVEQISNLIMTDKNGETWYWTF